MQSVATEQTDDEALLNTLLSSTPNKPTLLHQAITQQNFETLQNLLRKFIEFKAKGLIDNHFLEIKIPQGYTALALYFQTKPHEKITSELHHNIMNYFMLAGVNLNVMAKDGHVVCRMQKRAPKETLGKFLSFCGGRSIIAYYLQEAMVLVGEKDFCEKARMGQVLTSLISTGKSTATKKAMSDDEILALCVRKLADDNRLVAKLQDIIHTPSNEILRVIFDLDHCHPDLTTRDLCKTPFGQEHLKFMCQHWKDHQANPLEIYITELVDCFFEGGRFFNNQFSEGKKGFWGSVWNASATAVTGDVKAMGETITMINQFADMHQTPLLAKLQWMEKIVQSDGIAKNQAGKSLWRHIVRAIHMRPYLQMQINLTVFGGSNINARHIALCESKNYNPSYPRCTMEVYTRESSPNQEKDRYHHPDKDYRDFFYKYFCDWIEKHIEIMKVLTPQHDANATSNKGLVK